MVNDVSTAVCILAYLARTPGALNKVQLVILLYEQLHHAACHNVQLPRHIIHAVQEAVWAQIHLRDALQLYCNALLRLLAIIRCLANLPDDMGCAAQHCLSVQV